MQNADLAADHLRRAQARLAALDTLFDRESWADVVREAQEVVELALMGLLRASGIDPPRVHDVADVLLLEREHLPAAILPHLDELAQASRSLRRDRELAFYGTDDLTPSAFYRRDDATVAREAARQVVGLIAPQVLKP